VKLFGIMFALAFLTGACAFVVHYSQSMARDLAE